MAAPILRELDAGFAALTGSRVRWALLRGRYQLDDPPGDVDVLVHPDDVEHAQRVLVGSGFAPRRTWARGTQRSLLGYDGESDTWIALHVVSQVGFGEWYEFELPVASHALARSITADGVPMVHPADEFWITLLHVLLDKGEVPAKHRERLHVLAADAEGSPVAAALEDVAPGMSDRLLELVTAGRWDDVTRTSSAIFAAWSAADRQVTRLRWHHRASRLARKLVEPITRRALTIAILAPDGAGKTTLVGALNDRLLFPVRTYYLGLEGGRFAGDGSRIPGVGFVRRLVAVWRSYIAARYHTARSRFVVFDRYPYDARLADQRKRGPLGILRRWLLGRSLPAPDVLIVLDVPAPILHARKPEHTLEELTARRQAYRELAQQAGAVVVDGTGEPDEVVREVVAVVWHAYRERRRS